MKTGLFSLGAVALCQLVAAQPHPHLKHMHLHHAREAPAAPNPVKVIIFVDGNGNPISTSTEYATAATEKPKPDTYPVDNVKAPAGQPAANPTPAAQPSTTQPTTQPTHASDASSQKKPSGDDGDFGHGVSYAPYTADGQCKKSAEIKKDMTVLEFDVIRSYGTDCNQVDEILQALKGTEMKLFPGIWDIAKVEEEAQLIIDAVKKNGGDWGKIHTVSVGNELVDKGCAASDVTSAIGKARTCLRAAGFTGPVVTVDTMMAMYAHPELCAASDYCAFNCHAFFDDNVSADKAGKFVKGWVEKMSSVANGKMIVVTESGWPSNGSPHGLAVASPEAQSAAIASLKEELPNNLILYSAFNNPWLKDNAYTHGAEKFWGIKGAAPSS